MNSDYGNGGSPPRRHGPSTDDCTADDGENTNSPYTDFYDKEIDQATRIQNRID